MALLFIYIYKYILSNHSLLDFQHISKEKAGRGRFFCANFVLNVYQKTPAEQMCVSWSLLSIGYLSRIDWRSRWFQSIPKHQERFLVVFDTRSLLHPPTFPFQFDPGQGPNTPNRLLEGNIYIFFFWLVVSTHSKHISQNGGLPQIE